jgi:hypothetical protein
MDDATVKFFEKVPMARQLYYQQKLAELERAKDMIIYLTYARKWARVMHIVVGEEMIPVSVALDTHNGLELVEYVLNWALGCAHLVQAEIDEMLLAWPLMPDLLSGREMPQSPIGPGIAPEGPQD